MSVLFLYTTSGCHLCEQALELISPLLPENITLKLIDIGDSDALIDQYGIRIPVIRKEENNQELGWPFDADDFLSFLQA